MNMMPQNSAPGMPDQLQQQLQILSALKAQGIPQEQWPALLSVLMNNSNAQAAALGSALPVPTNIGTGQVDSSRDRNGYDQYMRSPPGGRRERSRSRSPNRWDRRRDDSPPGRRRDSPVYGEYSGNRNDRGGDFDRRGGRGGGRGNAYRQRSPQRSRRSPSPRRDDELPQPGPRWIQHDPNLPKGSIKGTRSQRPFVKVLAVRLLTILNSIQQDPIRRWRHVSISLYSSH